MKSSLLKKKSEAISHQLTREARAVGIVHLKTVNLSFVEVLTKALTQKVLAAFVGGVLTK
jgi:hypothetical protein